MNFIFGLIFYPAIIFWFFVILVVTFLMKYDGKTFWDSNGMILAITLASCSIFGFYFLANLDDPRLFGPRFAFIFASIFWASITELAIKMKQTKGVDKQDCNANPPKGT